MSAKEEIKKLGKKIDLFLLLSDSTISEELASLRHKILSMHATIESQLSISISYNISILRFGDGKKLSREALKTNIVEIRKTTVKVRKMSFFQKIKMARIMGIYGDALLDKVGNFNNARNVLAHNTAKDEEVQKYENLEKRLEVLKLAWEILGEMNKVRKIDVLNQVEDLTAEIPF